METLQNLNLTPYILKATALIGIHRKVGGNQFRHSFATLGILLDYKYFNDPVLLKAALLHDIVEEIDANLDDIRNIDNDGNEVVNLVLEVSKKKDETKEEYLDRLKTASKRAKIIKCADRISNLTDLHIDTHTDKNINKCLEQTIKYILPLAKEINSDFEKELKDLIFQRELMSNMYKLYDPQ